MLRLEYDYGHCWNKITIGKLYKPVKPTAMLFCLPQIPVEVEIMPFRLFTPTILILIYTFDPPEHGFLRKI